VSNDHRARRVAPDAQPRPGAARPGAADAARRSGWSRVRGRCGSAVWRVGAGPGGSYWHTAAFACLRASRKPSIRRPGWTSNERPSARDPPRAAPASVKRQRRRRRYRVSCDTGTADGLLLVFRSKMELRAGRECCKQAVSSTHHEWRVAQIEGRLHLVCGAAGGRASESGAGDGIQSSAGAAIGAASLLLWEMSSRAETGPPGNDH
jgi:hypothetical protein